MPWIPGRRVSRDHVRSVDPAQFVDGRLSAPRFTRERCFEMSLVPVSGDDVVVDLVEVLCGCGPFVSSALQRLPTKSRCAPDNPRQVRLDLFEGVDWHDQLRYPGEDVPEPVRGQLADRV